MFFFYQVWDERSLGNKYNDIYYATWFMWKPLLKFGSFVLEIRLNLYRWSPFVLKMNYVTNALVYFTPKLSGDLSIELVSKV